MSLENKSLQNINTGILPKDACIVIVHTQWNTSIVNKLVEGCVSVLKELEMKNFKFVQVPGAFEIPFSIKSIWESHAQKFEKPQVFIALGCVMRGETPHFEYISRAVTDGLMTLNLQLPVSVINGVLTVNNQQQADDRTGGSHGNKGAEAAFSALKMMELKYQY